LQEDEEGWEAKEERRLDGLKPKDKSGVLPKLPNLPRLPANPVVNARKLKAKAANI